MEEEYLYQGEVEDPYLVVLGDLCLVVLEDLFQVVPEYLYPGELERHDLGVEVVLYHVELERHQLLKALTRLMFRP